LRPILSDSQPKTTKKNRRAEVRAMYAIMMLVVDTVDLQHVDLQEEQRVELTGVPDDCLTGGQAEQREQRDTWRSSTGRTLRKAAPWRPCLLPSCAWNVGDSLS
jgi:hypothetical protein